MPTFSKRSFSSLLCVILVFLAQFASAQEKILNWQIAPPGEDVILWQYGGRGPGYGPNQLTYPHSATLLQNGNILIGETWNNRAIEVKGSDYPNFTAGSVVWDYSGIGYVYDTEELSNGNILIVAHTDEQGIGLGFAQGYYVAEVPLHGKVEDAVWQYGTPGVSGGGHNQLYRPTDADKLSNGNYLITDAGDGHRVIEVDQNRNIVWEYDQLVTPVDADYLPDRGTYLITDRGTMGTLDDNDRIIEVGKTDKAILREWKMVGGICLWDPMDADILDNGHMMICDRNNNRVIEIDIDPDNPSEVLSEVLWGYPTPLFNPYGARRLKNGYTLVTDASNHRVIIVGPQPQKEVDKPEAFSREILTYTIHYKNTGTTNAHDVTIEDKIPAKTIFVVGSVTANGGSVQYSNNNGVSWNYTPAGSTDPRVTHLRIIYSTISPQGTKSPAFQVKIDGSAASGEQITNLALITTGEIDIVVSSNEVKTTISGTLSQLRFTDAQYQDEDIYPYNDTIYLELADEDKAGAGGLQVTVSAPNTGDNETITLIETTTPGVFRGSLPNSLTQGVNDNDGTLKVNRGDPITAGYTDPQDAADVSTDNAAIASATPSTLRFMDDQYQQDKDVYPYDDTIYLELTDEDKAGAGSLQVTVSDPTTGDNETITVTETTTPGVFRGSLPNSLTQGGNDNDGTLKVNRGDPITAGYTDLQYPPDTATDTAAIASAAPDLTSSSKESSLEDANNDGYGNPGEEISYTITIRNTGGAPAENVIVTDPIPDYTTYLSGSISGRRGSETGLPDSLRWQIGAIPAGATVVLGFKVRINDPLPPGATEVSNYARLKEDDNPDTPIPPPPPVPLGEPDLSHSLKNVSWEDTNFDGQINPGEVLSYTITIHNKGNAPAENVVVIDTIPDYTTYIPGSITGTGWSEADLPNSLLRWQIGTIVAGDTVTLGFRVRISDSLPASVKQISNQAIVSGTNIPKEPTDDPRTPQPNDPTIEPPAWADLSSTFKTVSLEETDNDGFAEPGEVLAYTITIQNTGNAPANNVVVTDSIPGYTTYISGSITGIGGSETQLPDGLRWQVGTVTAGATVVLGFKVRINDPLPVSVSEVSNQGIVTGSNIPDEPTDDPNTPEPNDPTKKVVIKNPDLSGTTKTASLDKDLNGNGLVDPGETILYTITVKNTGGGEATGVVVTDTVPEYTAYVAGSIAGPGADDSNVSVMIWRIDTVAPNSERILTFNVRIADPFPEGISGVRNKAVVMSENTKPVEPDVPVEINKPDLSDTTKVVSNPGPMPGEIVTYTIVVRNTGDGTATETVFRDPVPGQTEYILGTLKLKGSLLTDASDFDAGDYNQTYPGGIFVRVGDLPPGDRAEISFDVKIGPHLAKDVIISNQGEVDSKETDPELTDSDGEDKNGDQSTDLRVGGGPNFSTTTKTVEDLDQDQEINPGDILEYEIIVRNTGNDTATKVVVTDPLPAQVTYLGPGSGLGPHEIQGSTLVWRFDEFGINQAEILTFQVKIKDEVETGTLISNQGLVTSKETVPELTDADGRDENGDQPTDVVVSGLPDLSGAVKEVRDVNGGLILPGDVLEYTIRIPNDGVADAVNVVFQDATPLLTTYMPGSATLNGNPVSDLPGSVSPLSTGLYIGLIPVGGQAVVTFRVQSGQGLAKGTPISNQGLITGKDIEELTDDDGDSTNGDNPTVVHIDGVVGLGVISGRVFIDYDGDKVEDPEDVGLPGTVVTAIDPAREVKVEKTDQDGNFTINYLEPTIYQVEFVKDGVLVGETSGIVIKPNELIWVILPVPYDGHLLVTKQTDKNEVMVGEYLTYTVRVTNHNYIEVGPINIEDQIPPGFKYLKGTTYLDDSLRDDPDISGNGRNLNFNLGMLPARSTTAVSYQLVVGAGVVVPGEYENAAWIKDETGEFTSDTASVVVEVVPDPTFDQSNIIGRVFCDNDGDGKWGSDDMGLEGVKVAIDNGWVFAITDITGKYHLKGIHPGTRVIKVDKATLPPGSVFITEESRFVDLTPGLPARVNFGIQCGRVEVIDVPMRLNIEQKTEPEPVIVTGNVKTMQAEINGREVGFPLADIRLKPEFEDKVMIKGSDLTERPIFRLQASGVEDIKKWSIIITDSGGETFWSVRGEGDIPSEILWDGKNEAGAPVSPGEMYSYQLRLEESDGDMAISPVRDLGVGIDLLISIILRGALFDTDKSFLRPEAKENLTEVAKVLRKYPDEPVVIEGHCDWRASDEYNLGLSDRRANSVKNYLVEVQGIPEERLTPIGYGESRPVATNSTEEGMQLNRRVEIKSAGQEKVEAPVIPPREYTPKVLLNRIAIPFSEEYDFSHTCLPHQIKKNKIELDMTGLDGKRSVVTKDIPSIKIAFSAKREMLLTGEELSLIKDRITVILKGVTEPDNQVFINEEQVEVSPDGIFEHSLALGIGITTYRIVAKNPAGYARAVTETISILASGDVHYETDRPRLTVLLPPEEVVVCQERLPIKGEASPPGTSVRINGQVIKTTPDGDFNTEIKLKEGINPLLIEVIGKDGSVEKLERAVRVDTDYIFLAAMADGLIGQIKTSGNIDPLSPDDKYDGDLYAEGRLAYYLKGKVKGKYLVTSSLDTDRKDEKRLLTNLDPDKYYPIYGDSSNSVYDSDVREQFYLRVDRDESYLLFGNYATGLSETELAGYNRTLYGGKFSHQSVSKTRYGDPVTKVILFGAEAHQRSAHNEIAANGGSIYHLNHPNIVEGSEQVRLEVRDKDTGRMLAKEGLERNAGYTVKYEEGRIYLKQPVPSVVDSDTLIEQHILPGHLVWIVIDYEYEVDDFQKGTAGGRISRQLGDHIALGATYVNEDRDKENYELTGFDLNLQAGEKTALSAEWGESKQEDTENYISDDGGLSFNKVTIGGAKGQAIKVGFQAEVAEWFEERGDWLRLGAYYKKLEAGFSANGTIQEQGSEKIGGEIITHLNEHNTITLRHTLTKLLDDGGTIALGSLRGKEEQISSLNIEQRLDSLDLAAAYQHTAVNDPHDTEQEKIDSLAAGVGWQISDRLKASLKYQHILEGKENHQTTAGLLAKLSEKLTARLQGTVGSQGNSALVGLAAKLSEQVTANLLHTISGQKQTTMMETTNKLSESSEVYARYQLTSAVSGKTNQALLGLNNRWKLAEGVMANLNYERSKINVNNGDDSSKDAVSVGLEYLASDKGKASTKWELILDENSGRKRRHFRTLNAANMKLSDDFSAMGKINYGRTENRTTKVDEAQFRELSAGLAYRPLKHDRLNLLAKYTNLLNLRPGRPGSGYKSSGYKNESNIAAAEGAFDLSQRFQLVEKIAVRWRGEERNGRDLGSTRTELLINRLNFHVTSKWDADVEYRILRQKEADERRDGFLLEANRMLAGSLRAGVGYNFTDFSDNLYSNNNYTTYGWFLRLQGKY
ncbi:MAG: OmpA family protein [bacterium]|nr:OmpA family protein [bacterium]